MTTTPAAPTAHVVRPRRTTAAVAALVLATLALTGCGEDAPAAPAPGEASTGLPLNVGSEEPVATATDVAP